MSLRLLTWNLNGLDDHRVDERTEAAVFLAVTGLTLTQLARGGMTRAAPDVLMFQEVTRHTYTAHLRSHLPRAGYTLYPARPPESETFEVIGVRQPATLGRARSVPLDRSLYGRNLHIVETVGSAGSPDGIRLLTAHFDGGTEESEVRIAESRQAIAEMHEHSVFAGDTNLRNTEWEAVAEWPEVTDAWEELGRPADLRDTWQMPGRRARFDRVWLGGAMKVVSMEAVGQVSGGRVPPSDHIGLLVEIEIEIRNALDHRGSAT